MTSQHRMIDRTRLARGFSDLATASGDDSVGWLMGDPMLSQRRTAWPIQGLVATMPIDDATLEP
jgi:hypothetical protein